MVAALVMVHFRHIQGTARLTIGALGALVMYTAFAKMFNAGSFSDAVAAHGVLAPALVESATHVVPAIELACGLFALVAVVQATRALGAAALLLGGLFAVLGLYALVVSSNPPAIPASCGCGLGNRPVTDWTSLGVRNGATAALLMVAASVARPRMTTG